MCYDRKLFHFYMLFFLGCRNLTRLSLSGNRLAIWNLLPVLPFSMVDLNLSGCFPKASILHIDLVDTISNVSFMLTIC